MKSEVTIGDNRLQIVRIFNAPRPLVFSYWTQPDKLQRWTGCKETVKCDVVMDFRVGGFFTQNMTIAVDGGTCEHSMTGIYDEIVEPERIVYRADFGPVTTKITVEFLEHGAGTKLVLTHDGLPDDFFRKTVGRGTSESFEKLDSLLEGEAATPA